MIADRIIEPGTLHAKGPTTSVEVRIPWYRAIPGSCISEVGLTVDGVSAPPSSIRWTMNDRTYELSDLVDADDEWWFPVDSAIVEGAIELTPDLDEHEVTVDLKLYIPYIVTDHGVLRIEEQDTKRMQAVIS